MAKAIPTPHSAKVFCARKTLRVFFIGHKKPSLQPERYAKYFLTGGNRYK
jgi:hypothetical protein